MSETKAARVRAKLNHPMIDGDSHIVEYMPVLRDMLREVGGASAEKNFVTAMGHGLLDSGKKSWYDMTWDERRDNRGMRPPWWPLPTKNTIDRCTSMIPKLYHERMDDFGLDYAVLYPTVGLLFPHMANDEMRALSCRAFNEYAAAYYDEYADRMTVAATIPLHTPEEGIRELEHAKNLGLKVAVIPAYVKRPVAAFAKLHPKLAHHVTWLDSYGIDSEHDYDPFWAKCIELGFSVSVHSAGMGLEERSSMSNYMYNHMGHFGAAGEVLTKSLLMGGVTRRFPKLRVALLEGGVVNGSRLYADIVSRWKKRRLESQDNLDPASLDVKLAQDLFSRYGNNAILNHLDELEKTIHLRPHAISEDLRDDFAAMKITRKEEIEDIFIPNFYFGCESDDPHAALAFNTKINPFGSELRAFMTFDLGHWDVTDMGEAAAEAYGLVEEELITPENFRAFAFSNAVQLYCTANPDFFRGTAIETVVASELGQLKEAV